jgi:hypothetical protein
MAQDVDPQDFGTALRVLRALRDRLTGRKILNRRRLTHVKKLI